MANVNIPILNPIRLRSTTKTIDHLTTFPRVDLMTQRVDYQKGIYAVPDVYIDWLVGTDIYFQARIVSTLAATCIARIYNYITGAYVSAVSFTNINPVGWVGDNIIRIRFLAPSAGYYYITMNFIGAGESFISDVFKVNENGQGLVWIKYKNSYNDNGMVWGSTYYNFFATGFVAVTNSETENSISKEDDGVSIYSTSSFGKRVMNLGEIHSTQLRQLERIMQLDDLIVNGEPVICEQGLEINQIPKTDLYNVTANLALKNIDIYANFD
jgi:hypothetical protein